MAEPYIIRLMQEFQERPAFRPEAPKCGACGTHTRMGKPYCPEHVSSNPYVKALEREVVTRNTERVALARGKPLARSLLARELLSELRNLGAVSVARLARLTRLTAPEAETQVREMERAGLVEVSESKRGSLVVSLANLLKSTA